MKLAIIALSLLCCTSAVAQVDSSDAPGKSNVGSNVGPMQNNADQKPNAQQCSNFMRHVLAIPDLKASAEYKYCLKTYGAPVATAPNENGTRNDVPPLPPPPP